MSSRLFTSESVTEGHPDKVADRISDSILDAILAQDPQARVACETFVTTGLVLIGGEISTAANFDLAGIARQAIREVGYDKPEYGFSYDQCAVLSAVHEQSPDIAQAVLKRDNQDSYESLGAGDQGIMYGYACNETPELMPLPISLAHRLVRRLAQVRREGLLPYLRPDGKSQVTIESHDHQPARAHTVVLSAQHDPEIQLQRLQADLLQEVIRPVIGDWMDERTQVLINPSGRFVIGGPPGDTGMTGRKIEVDTYGAFGSHGGGAFSGKDPTKVDRSASYMARYVAKNIVAAGLADECEVQIAYVIGQAHPVAVTVDSSGTGTIPDEEIEALILEQFDFRPAAIIERLELHRPIYSQLSAYGHFGRPELDLSWERTDQAEVFKQQARLRQAAG
ncbi:MAG TPA: methionine adenosyltransferase [Candidatus Fraserbacteria bacterium]|nr:methionine adenosyltransferase [Candidatus Fraserbacteria bacterium]